MEDGRPDIGDAALAVAAAAVDAARLPLRVAARLPGVRLLARDGAFVRARLSSRIEGLAARAIDGVLGGTLPDAAVQSAIDHQILQRIAAEVLETPDLDGAVTALLDQEAAQRLVRAVLTSPSFDRLRLTTISEVPDGRHAT